MKELGVSNIPLLRSRSFLFVICHLFSFPASFSNTRDTSMPAFRASATAQPCLQQGAGNAQPAALLPRTEAGGSQQHQKMATERTCHEGVFHAKEAPKP